MKEDIADVSVQFAQKGEEVCSASGNMARTDVVDLVSKFREQAHNNVCVPGTQPFTIWLVSWLL